MTDSLALITTVLRDHTDETITVGPGAILRCSALDWSAPLDANDFGQHAHHRAQVLRDALIAAGWREPGGCPCGMCRCNESAVSE